MSDIQLDTQADQAVILEGAVKQRVRNAVVEVFTGYDTEIDNKIARKFSSVVKQAVEEAIKREKEKMMMEIAIQVGKIIGDAARNEDRRPLWESTPEEFGLTKEVLNTHNLGKINEPEDRLIEGSLYALQKQS